MPFTTYSEYLSALGQNGGFEVAANGVSWGRALRLQDNGVRAARGTPATPTTSVALDRSSDRALNNPVANGGSGRLCVVGARIMLGGTQSTSQINGGACWIVADLLNISGGLDATLTTAQTTNLPTAALTRYTSGEGVMAAVYIHTSLGATATTFTASYTNSAGTPGRTSTATTIGSTVANAVGSVMILPLQSGDTGVKSVESVTLAATTGSVGNFGIVLFKPLTMLWSSTLDASSMVDAISTGGMVGAFNEIVDDACLTVLGSINSGQQQTFGSILTAEA